MYIKLNKFSFISPDSSSQNINLHKHYLFMSKSERIQKICRLLPIQKYRISKRDKKFFVFKAKCWKINFQKWKISAQRFTPRRVYTP